MTVTPYDVTITNRQSTYPVPHDLFRRAVQQVFQGEGFSAGEVGIAVVDNQEIHETNRRFLNHDYPTDVITFPMGQAGAVLSGEIMLSAQYAADEAINYGWAVEQEMTLYVVHGCLHLAGYDDHQEEDRQEMRRLEQHYLRQLGIECAETFATSVPRPGAT